MAGSGVVVARVECVGCGREKWMARVELPSFCRWCGGLLVVDILGDFAGCELFSCQCRLAVENAGD